MDDPDNAAELEMLRRAGHTVTTDAEFVAAWADYYGLSLEGARHALNGSPDDVIDVT